MNMPGTNGVDRVGDCEPPVIAGVEDGAVGAGGGAGTVCGLGVGAEAGAVETGGRPAQPASISAAINPNDSHWERKNDAARAVMRSVNRCPTVFENLQSGPYSLFRLLETR